VNTQQKLEALKVPFAPSDIDWRIGSCGKTKDGKWWAMCLAYITGRAVQDRLDATFGGENWKVEYKEWAIGTPGVLCGLSIRLDGEWVTKWDGADQPDTEPMKGGLSNALKRAAVPWGIGRYLYHLPKTWADIREDGAIKSEFKDKSGAREWVNWNPPALPSWAIPEGTPVSGTHPDPVEEAVRALSVQRPAAKPAAPKPAKKASTDAVPPCPTCGGLMWDNREKKASGEYKPKSPDFTCRNKECKNADGFRSGSWVKNTDKVTAAAEPYNQPNNDNPESFAHAPEGMENDGDDGLPF
jgi:hypothetical protein